jgi:two-component system CheB/CheR fusion protein
VDGLLFLGSSESLGQSSDLFVTIDKKWKIYRRNPASNPQSGIVISRSKYIENDFNERLGPARYLLIEPSSEQLIEAILNEND